jgi:hypothetical protein
MIVALVRFVLPSTTDKNTATRLFASSAESFRAVPGLLRKYYVLGEDCTGGGCYLWRSREDAESFYTVEWRRGLRARFGSEPSVEYFDAPVVVDNVSGEVVTPS